MRQEISEEQNSLLKTWLGRFSIVKDHSWPLQDTFVLRVRTSAGKDLIVKASTTSHHIRREIAAYTAGFPGLNGLVPVLKHASVEEGLLVTEYLPGSLVEGSEAESNADTYRQAGILLAALHRPAGISYEYADALLRRTQAQIDRAHGLVQERSLVHLAKVLKSVKTGPVQMVTTHGDYQPRNWLEEDGLVKIIDFGRADARPWVHDLIRLNHQQFVKRPDLEEAFYLGLGKKVEAPEADIFLLENLNQAISTVVWAHQIGDYAFERSGVAMVDRALSGSSPDQ